MNSPQESFLLPRESSFRHQPNTVPNSGSPYGLDAVLFGFDAKWVNLTKGQQAYAAVRRAIVTHDLPSDIPLEESLLLEHFAFGRTPLREALKRLTHEQILTWPPHQAPRIRDIGLYEIQHLYAMRRLLECEIASLAANRATAADINRMNRFRDMLIEASEADRVYEAVELDFALHSVIALATQNRFLLEASNNLNLQSLRLWFRAQDQLGVSTIHHSHTELVDSIGRHDVNKALELTKDHIESSWERQQVMLNARSFPTS